MIKHRERIVVESDELADKINKLVSFIDTNTFSILHIAEKYRLKIQLAYMRLYLDVLNDRINANDY